MPSQKLQLLKETRWDSTGRAFALGEHHLPSLSGTATVKANPSQRRQILKEIISLLPAGEAASSARVSSLA